MNIDYEREIFGYSAENLMDLRVDSTRASPQLVMFDWPFNSTTIKSASKSENYLEEWKIYAKKNMTNFYVQKPKDNEKRSVEEVHLRLNISNLIYDFKNHG